VTFELSGLADEIGWFARPYAQIKAVRKANSEAQAKLVAAQAAEQEQLEEAREAERVRLAALRAECVRFSDGSAEKVQTKKMQLPPKESREMLSLMRNSRLDALYD
jgi:hypothetical protein